MTSPAPPALRERLRAIVGASHLITEGDRSAWELDQRRRQRGRALAIVRPASTGQVAAIVRACAEHGTAIVPQGGNTGLVLGSVPDASGTELLLSLTRMARIRALDEANATLCAEAGCVLQTVQQAAARAGWRFPLSLGAEGSATVGGVLSTNAGGTQVLRYGNARELCLGLEVVTPAGEVWHGLSGLRKNNTGYDLRDLFIGAEGTLGVITAATLRLFAPPAAEAVAWVALPSLDAALALLTLARRQGDAALTGFEVMGRFALELVHAHFPALGVPLWQGAPWCALLELADSDSDARAQQRMQALLRQALDAGVVQDAVLAQSQAQAQALWHLRECIPLAQAAEGLNIKHDISLPLSAIPAFERQMGEALAAALTGVRVVCFGHLGDGNLHYNVQAPAGQDAAAFLRQHEARVNTMVYERVYAAGGAISAEHGIGSLKAAQLPRYQSPVALRMMHAIKQALDPQGLMNPGRVLLRGGADALTP